MSTYTDKEIAMMKAFYQTSMDTCGVCDESDNMSYMNARDLMEDLGWSGESVGGVMQSLDRKGAIVDCMESFRKTNINDWVLCHTKAEWLRDNNHVED